MKKFFVSILLIVLIALMAIWFFKAPVMSIYLSKLLKCKISISNVEMSKSHMKIDNLEILNPVGFKPLPAFASKEIDISYDWKKLKGQPSYIEKIELNDNYLRIECVNPRCSENNWTKIIKNIGERKVKEKDGEVIIKKISLKGLNVDIQGMEIPLGIKKNTHIDYLEFNNVSSKVGFPIDELILAIFKEAGLFDFIKEMINPRKIFDNYFKPINPFGENEKNRESKTSQESL
jgi:hypothetical protein